MLCIFGNHAQHEIARAPDHVAFAYLRPFAHAVHEPVQHRRGLAVQADKHEEHDLVTEGLFVEATYGQTETDRTSFEVLSGAVELLMDEDRTLSYYNLSFGYNILPGEVFLGKSRAFNSALYIAAGAGNTEFAGDENFTVTVGMGYRLLAQDWLALHLGVRDHMFDSDLLGEEKTTHNIESFLSLTFFF